MSDDKKVLLLLTLLTKLTSEKKLQWNATPPPSSITDGSDDVVSLHFETTYKNQTISLYERRHQVYTDEDQFYWTGTIVVAFLDGSRRNLWEYSEPSAAIVNLFELVRRSAAKVDDLIDDLLSDSATES